MSDQRGPKSSDNNSNAGSNSTAPLATESSGGSASLPDAQPASAVRSASERPPGEGRGSTPPTSRKESSSSVRAVGVSSEEQRKLEDIRKKLKDIFVTNEKPAPAADVVKPAEQQTVSSGLLDLRDIAKLHESGNSGAGVDDMLFLSGGLFGDARPTGSLKAPDTDNGPPSALPIKPPPPPQAAKSATVLDEILVDTEVEPASEKSESRLLEALAKAPPPPAPKAEPDAALPAAKPMSGRTLALLTIVGALVLGGVFYAVMRSGGDEPAKTAEDTSAAAVTNRTGTDLGVRQGQNDTASPTDTPGAAAITPGSPVPTAAAPDKTSAAQAADPGKPATTSGTGEASQGAPTKDTSGSGSSKPAPTAEGTATAASTGAPPATTTAAPPPPPPTPAAPAAAEFNAEAARAAMSGAAAKAASCKGDGPAGSGTVAVTFSTSGRVTSARLEGGSLQGTPAGGCVVSAFRGISVPPFGGSPVTVRKTVNVR